MTNFVPVIICGGAGSRLWPLSRENHPKPLIKLGDGLSLVQHALKRAMGLPGAQDLITVTNRDLFFAMEDEYRQMDCQPRQARYLLESEGRNTAAAIALASLDAVQAFGDDVILCVLPADHVVADTAAFGKAVERAQQLASEGRLVTFGIRPDRAETGYGYIEADGEDVRQFVEKPDAETAESYLKSGRFLWNAGMFCFKASVMISLMEQFCPDILDGTRGALTAGRTTSGDGLAQVTVDPEKFAEIRSDSIDYAVLEKAPNVAVVACDIGWNDIGSWSALGEQFDRDESGNLIDGNVSAVNSSNNVVSGSGRLVGLVGVEDLIIADTPDALLVASRESAQDVKLLYNRLKEAGDETHRIHSTAHRPWGSYTVLEEGPRFKIKRIEVKPGASLSLQMHHHRAEHWVVVSGTAKVVNGERELMLTTDQSTYIPCGAKHRLENPGVLKLVLIEVQTGDYLGEDDIVRFDDVYGRG
ncbi:mannose-1-phosphate guanylyltransferase/mannose-6-phosphate isomerase [Nitratireductor basaltis]|uniref:mannose-1-phosphate guanylyltransferase n=1 Tax=Nitratireductor basaltis TaxID=472175 RepID=A0A084U7W8_9HYPH|nr:mannose-1-phosphate guanylyltransferase/mannose-6-phosphate isomerase [Nitratireductor basaltis]KFB09054.1 Mannose-6-phosphate isomerase, type 2 [Nitratireductor basaltis]